MLNRNWQSQVFAQALAASVNGTYIFVGAQHPEVQDLVDRGFLKLDKRKKDADGNVSATAVEGITQDQVDATLAAADATAPTPAATPAPVETLAPEPAPAPAPAPTAAPVPTPAPVDTLAQTAQPVFGADQNATAVSTSGDVVLGGTDHTVLNTVELGGEQFEIETGVQYVKRSPNIANIARTPREDKYPFAALADAKRERLDDDTFLPSFHVAGKQLKNMSNLLSKYIKKYEASHGVTFRGQQVKENDPKGAGVRVFAMNPATAPERKSPIRKKDAATAETLAASPATPAVDGSEVTQAV